MDSFRVQAVGAIPLDTRRALASPRVVSTDKRANSWARAYVRRLAWSDAVIVVASVMLAQVMRFGTDVGLIPIGSAGIPIAFVPIALIIGWLVSLRVFQSQDRRIIGSGPDEYSRVVSASVSLFGILAIVDLLLRLSIARGFLALALPVGTIALIVSRWSWRQRLSRQRARFENLERVVVIGEKDSATALIDRLTKDPSLGYQVVGACTPTTCGAKSLTVGDAVVPVLGVFDDVIRVIEHSDATTVAITSAEALGSVAMQDLSWDLEGLDVTMLVAPGLTDVAGPRMMVRPVAGLPLLHVDKPRYEGAVRLRKAVFDRIGATMLLIAILPVLVAVAIAIKIDSRGPVFYRATRVGLNNDPFRMWKFRSMVVDAESLLPTLMERDEGAGVLFKMRDDPRVTRVGAVIRRFSLDELPQLFNVLTGGMSLVGPRPPLSREVEEYDGRIARRMLVKPGMTGLWQVSGRSDLSWEDSIRLDLSYVENWSMTQDLVILWRTARAVASSDGAY